MESRLRQPGFSRGRHHERAGAARVDTGLPGGGSLPPIGDRSGSLPPIASQNALKKNMLPHPGLARARSVGHYESTAHIEQGGAAGERGAARNTSLPPLLRPLNSASSTGSQPPPRQSRQSLQSREANAISEESPPIGGRTAVHRSHSHRRKNSQNPPAALAEPTSNAEEPQQLRRQRSGYQRQPPSSVESPVRDSSPLKASPAQARQQSAPRGGNTAARPRNSPPLPPGGKVALDRAEAPQSQSQLQQQSGQRRSSPRARNAPPQQKLPNGSSKTASSAYPSEARLPAARASANLQPARPASPPVPAVASQPMMDFGAGADADAGGEILVPCPHCNRKFREEAYAKHVQICVKVFVKERKKFNVAAQRMPEEARKLVQENKRAQRRTGASRTAAKEPETVGKVKSNWRLKSEAFRNAIQESRVVTQCQREGRPLPPPKASKPELDDRVPCPHCGRKFGQQQAERHIPKCAETKARPGGILRAGAAGKSNVTKPLRGRP